MDGIRNAPPIPRGVIDPRTGKAGYKDVFAQTKFKNGMLAAGISEQAGHLFYQNSFLVPLARVPLNRQSKDILRDRNFKEPIAFPDKLLVAIPGAGNDAGAHFGALQHITPEELIPAYILPVARDTKNHAKMKTWRYHLLTVTFSFVIAAGEDFHWKQARVREDTEAAFRVVYRSALQRVYEINMALARRAGPIKFCKAYVEIVGHPRWVPPQNLGGRAAKTGASPARGSAWRFAPRKLPGPLGLHLTRVSNLLLRQSLPSSCPGHGFARVSRSTAQPTAFT